MELDQLAVAQDLTAISAIVTEKLALCKYFEGLHEEARVREVKMSESELGLIYVNLGSTLETFHDAILVFAANARKCFKCSASGKQQLIFFLWSSIANGITRYNGFG